MNAIRSCRDCSAPVRWAETDRGKNILIDAEPVPDGDLALMYLDPQSQKMQVQHLRRGETVAENIPRYTCHFGTCPMREPKEQRR